MIIIIIKILYKQIQQTLTYNPIIMLVLNNIAVRNKAIFWILAFLQIPQYINLGLQTMGIKLYALMLATVAVGMMVLLLFLLKVMVKVQPQCRIS